MTPAEEIAPLSDLNIDVAVVLDRRMLTVSDIVALEVGSVIELPRAAGENIDLYVGDALVGYGEIVISEAVMGFRITGFRTDT